MKSEAKTGASSLISYVEVARSSKILVQVSRSSFINSWTEVPDVELLEHGLWQCSAKSLEREAEYHAPWCWTTGAASSLES